MNTTLDKIYITNKDNIWGVFDCNTRYIFSVSRWINHLVTRRDFSQKTILNYANSMKVILNTLYYDFIKNGDYLNLDHVLTSLRHDDLIPILNKENYKVNSNKIHETALKSFYRWIQDEPNFKLIFGNPFRGGNIINKPRRSSKLPKHIPLNHIIDMMNQLSSENLRCLIHFLYDTGLRISEALNLKVKDLPCYKEKQDYYQMDIAGAKGRGGKPNYRKTIISNVVLHRILKLHSTPEYRFSDDYTPDSLDKPLFLTKKGKNFTREGITKCIKLAAVKANLDKKMFTPHAFRHSFTFSIISSEFGNNHNDRILLAKVLLGHSKIKTTEIYFNSPCSLINIRNASRTRIIEAQKIFDETFKKV